jgi:hypothetical protein
VAANRAGGHADHEHHCERDPGDLEQHVRADDQVHTGGHHRRRVDQRRHRRRASPWRRAARPCSGSCADFPIAPANSNSAITVAASFVRTLEAVPEDRHEVQRAELEDQCGEADEHQRVPDACGDERLLRRLGVPDLVEPEADQQERAGSDALPPEVEHR